MELEISEENLIKYPELPWNYYLFSYNPNITWEIILMFPEGINGNPWDKYFILFNKNITFEIIRDNPEGHPWDYSLVSRNSRIVTIQTVLDNPDFPWDFRTLYFNENITLDIINEYNFLPWKL